MSALSYYGVPFDLDAQGAVAIRPSFLQIIRTGLPMRRLCTIDGNVAWQVVPLAGTKRGQCLACPLGRSFPVIGPRKVHI